MTAREAGAAAGEEHHNRDPLRINGARARILDTAYALFSRHGIHAVGIDRIIAEADVAKATLYHHFPSKEALVIAFLELRNERWIHDWLEVEAERRAASPQGRALAVFDALDEWFHRPDFEGCSFVNTLLEITDADSRVHEEAVRQMGHVREVLEGYAEQAGVKDPVQTGYQLQIIVVGSIVCACGADPDAALRARPLVASLLASAS
jgi:AcrR family transcriptional regulator